MTEIERERRALEIFGEVCGLEGEARLSALAAHCGDNAELRRRVETLLAADDAAGTTSGTLLSNPERTVEDFLEQQVRRIAGGAATPSPAPGNVGEGDYVILRLIAEGATASVYEAEQQNPRRLVAIKVVRAGLLSPQVRKRFEYEAQVLGRLEHPGIARLYEADTRAAGGAVRAFLAMELVRGLPIDRYADDHNLTLPDRLQLFLRVCDAIEYAHRMGVLHRDLKPANILVDATGQPKVLDFGIARALDREEHWSTVLTQDGQMLGTLPYMSPEQVEGRSGVDTRCDVYALGVLLYKVLTGRLPIDVSRDGIATAARRICGETPAPVGQHDRRLRGDIETVVARCLEKEPPRRYGGVPELADELRRILDGRPIEARSDSPLYLLRKTAWRHRRSVAAAAVFLALAASFVLYASVQSQHNRELAQEAIAARDKAARHNEELRRGLYFSNIGFAQSAIGNNDVGRARTLLDSCPTDLRDWEWTYLRAQTDQSSTAIPLGTASPVRAIDLASAGPSRPLALATDAGRVFVTEGPRGPRLFETQFPDGQVVVAISPDGHRLACGPWMDELRIVDLAHGAELWRAPAAPPPEHALLRRLRALRFSPDGSRLATAGFDGHLRLRDAATGRPIWDIDTQCLSILCLAFTPDATRLVTGDDKGRLRIWRAADGALLSDEHPHDGAIASVALSQDGHWIATGANDGQITVRPADGGPERARIKLGETVVWSIDISPDGSSVAAGTDDNLVRIWTVGNPNAIDVRRGHANLVHFVSFAPDGSLLSASADSTLRRWDLDPSRTSPVIHAGDVATQDCTFSPDGQAVLGACNDGTTRLWNVSTRQELWRDARPVTTIRAIATDPARSRTATAADDGSIRLTDLTTGTLLLELHGDPAGATSAAFSPDGRHLVVGERAGTCRLFDLNTPSSPPIATIIPAHPGGPVWDVAFAPDGTHFASAGADGHVKLWSPGTDSPAFSANAGSPTHTLRFSPDSHQLAAGTAAGAILLFDAHNLSPLRTLHGHQGAVTGLAFHPLGHRLASGGADRKIRLWDIDQGLEVLTLRGHRRQVQGISFNPNGTTLASSSADGTIRFWSGSDNSHP